MHQLRNKLYNIQAMTRHYIQKNIDNVNHKIQVVFLQINTYYIFL
jgi:hypothetical protein